MYSQTHSSYGNLHKPHKSNIGEYEGHRLSRRGHCVSMNEIRVDSRCENVHNICQKLKNKWFLVIIVKNFKTQFLVILL